MSHDTVVALIAPYVLGSATEDERHLVDAHIDTCAPCREELASLAETAAEMAHMVPLETPPAHLRDRVLAAAVGAAQHAEPAAQVVELRPRRRFDLQRLLVPSLAAACGLLAIFSVWSSVRIADLQGGRTPPTVQASAQPLKASGALSGTTITLIEGKRSYRLDAKSLPDPGRNRAWQVWRIDTDDQVASLGVIEHGGRMTLPLGNLDGVAVIAITLEPAGGSKLPSGTPLAERTLVA